MIKTISVWKVFLFLLIVETGIIFTSCSSEDNNTKEEDLVEIDYDKGQDYNGLHVLLQLLNEDGVAVKTFHEGKNIYFKLVIRNNREEDVNIPDFDKFIGYDTFKVLSTDGKDLGSPYDGYLTKLVYVINPGDSLTIKCPWLDDQSAINPILVNNPNNESRIDFIKQTSRPIIHKGNYYTEFSITFYDGEKITCKKEFRVI